MFHAQIIIENNFALFKPYSNPTVLNYRQIFYQQYYSYQLGRNASDFNQKRRDEARHLAREILPLLPTQPSSRIIDIGCGIGTLVWLCQQQGYSETQGIDISPQMVTIAQELGTKNVQQADLLPFLEQHSEQFDLIMAIDVIEHFTKDELVRLLQYIHKALLPNGQIIFRTPNADALFATLYTQGDFTHENQLNVSSAEQLLLSCGFQKVEVKNAHISLSNPFKEWLRRGVWWLYILIARLLIFASGRSSQHLVFTPNLIIIAQK